MINVFVHLFPLTLLHFQVYLVDSGKLRLYRVGMEELDQPIDSYEVVLRHNVFGTEG